MDELKSLGWDIRLFPLVFQKQKVVHPSAKLWVKDAYFSPINSRTVIRENLKKIIEDPRIYFKLLVHTLVENIKSPKFLVRKLYLFPKIIWMAEAMRELKIQHIHAHYATFPAFAAWLIHQLTGINYSITVHAHDIFVDQVMLGTKLGDAEFIIAISDYNREFLVSRLGDWVLDKTYVVHCGINPENYSITERNYDQIQRLEILSIGSLQPYKGFPYLIQACANLRDRNIPFRCSIIGGGKNYRVLERMILQNRLEKHVFLLGPKTQDQVSKLLAEAHCYVQPSVVTSSGKMEGIPVALMEALASGLPAIATSISGIPELIRPQKTGYLVEQADSSGLAEKLAEVYTKPKE
ncbi:MAG: glycosyltransferase, partial [Aliifodinibius sp.]|nr:glycosyltransferase [Fodinibius sp.]